MAMAPKTEAASLSLRPCLGEEERRGEKTGSQAAQDGLELTLTEEALLELPIRSSSFGNEMPTAGAHTRVLVFLLILCQSRFQTHF